MGTFTMATGFGMLAVGLTATLIGGIIIWKVINMVKHYEEEEKERKEREKKYGSN